MSDSVKYFKVEKISRKEEARLVRSGKHVRNYGRLNQRAIEKLSEMELQDDGKGIPKRAKPWRMDKFVASLLSRKGRTYGMASYEGYTVRVIDGGVVHPLGIGGHEHDEDDSEQWSGFELWRELLGSSLINCVPDRPFTLYVFAKDASGDDTPIYYMELEVDGAFDRHTVIWEMEQVLPWRDKRARAHEAEKASSMASAYQKVYFFINWDVHERRTIERIILNDLPKPGQRSFQHFLEEMSLASWTDAFVSILIIVFSTIVSLRTQRHEISLIAGLVVSGIAAEEWLAPQTIIFGAVARFLSNESLALQMYYKTGLSLSTKRVLITLLASIAEVTSVIEEQLGIKGVYGLQGRDLILLVACVINVVCLMPTALSGVYGMFSHSDFPSQSSYTPHIYCSRVGYVRQMVDDLRAVEEYSSVYRPLLHWQSNKRFLGSEIDLSAPGSLPQWYLYMMASPASAKLAIAHIYGKSLWQYAFLFPIVFVEQVLLIIGGILTLLMDIPVTSCLLVNLVLRVFGLNRKVLRALNKSALRLYEIPHLYLGLVYAIFSLISLPQSLDKVDCRGRSTARLYRLSLVQRVRTGRSSNHCFKFGEVDGIVYYRCSDQVIVNPFVSKIGMIESNKLLFKRHKLLWSSTGGRRYVTPVLSCGDNTVSRRTSIIPTNDVDLETGPDDDSPDKDPSVAPYNFPEL